MDLISENDFQVQIDKEGKSIFLAIAKWGNFLSILGFANIGLIVLSALVIGGIIDAMVNPLMGGIGGMTVTIIFLFVATILFIPTFFHFQYIQLLRKSLAQNNTGLFNDAIRKLKDLYVYIGIFSIVLQVLGLLFSLLGAII